MQPLNNMGALMHALRLKKRWNAGRGIVQLRGAEIVREPYVPPKPQPKPPVDQEQPEEPEAPEEHQAPAVSETRTSTKRSR